jgi:hypothetical protein
LNVPCSATSNVTTAGAVTAPEADGDEPPVEQAANTHAARSAAIGRQTWIVVADSRTERERRAEPVEDRFGS